MEVMLVVGMDEISMIVEVSIDCHESESESERSSLTSFWGRNKCDDCEMVGILN